MTEKLRRNEMSDELRKDDEVEGHYREVGATDQTDEESEDESDSDVEAHVVRYPNVRMD
jgi:hypothetical protein